MSAQTPREVVGQALIVVLASTALPANYAAPYQPTDFVAASLGAPPQTHDTVAERIAPFLADSAVTALLAGDWLEAVLIDHAWLDFSDECTCGWDEGFNPRKGHAAHQAAAIRTAAGATR